MKRFGLLLVQYPHTCLVPWTLGKVKNGRENNNFESKKKKKKNYCERGKREALLRIHRVEMEGGAGQIEKDVMEPRRGLNSSRNHI